MAMTTPLAATTVRGGGPVADGAAPAAALWRGQYWKLRGRGRKALRELALLRRLRNLRRRALAGERFRPGCLGLDGCRIHYDDLLSLYMEYKHIFAWGLYDFRPAGARPLVLDCGSHLGLGVLRFKRLVPDCRVVAFEPDPEARTLLERNIRDNGLAGVQVVPAALAAQPGTARFISDGADGGALACANAARAAPSLARGRAVPTVVLSDYLGEPVDLLKMNIEGAECDVLHEAAAKLDNVRQMVVEYHGFPECGQRLHEILALLDSCGFRYLLHHFDYETNGAVRPPFRIGGQTRFFVLIAATRLSCKKRYSHQAAALECERGFSPERRPEPVSRSFGLDRGVPIDRHYIEDFLSAWRGDVRGHVLEVGSGEYTRRFGGPRVTQCDVLNLHAGPGTTLVADLTHATQIPDATYDCVILTQTLPFIFDVHAALRTTYRILKPGGALLLTVPGISQVSRHDAERWGDYWRFAPQGVQRLLHESFAPSDTVLRTYGNVRSAAALLEGRAVHELPRAALDHADPDYPVLIAARVKKRCQGSASRPTWDDVADCLDEYPVAGECYRYAVGLRPLLELPKTAQILEVGCGSGRVLRTLKDLGYRRLVGLEISAQRLAVVQQRGPDAAQLVRSAGVPFAPRSFDAVVSTGVIEHVRDPRAWLAQLARVVRPGGIVSLTSDTYMWRWLQWLGLYRSVQPIDQALWPGTLIRWARSAGLRLTRGGGFYNTPDQRRFLLKQLARRCPGGRRLRWYLSRSDARPALPADEVAAIRAALERLPAQMHTGRQWCIWSYESFYWFRRVENCR
jgi:FkbM family methyltransferase